jgi:hypothetical protein
MKKLIYLFIGILATGLISCSEDFLDPELQQTKKFDEALETATDLHNAVKAVYANMNTAEYYGRDYIVFGEVRSDNTANDFGTGRYINVSNFQMIQSDGYATTTWDNIYECIQQANIVIQADVSGDAAEIDYYKGQAYALRGLLYFDLMRLYSTMFVTGYDLGIPLVTEYDETGSSEPPARATIAQTRTQIEDDFTEALSLMDPAFDGTKQEMSVDGAKALFSRYYLYTGQYTQAMNWAYDVLTNPNYSYQYTDPSLYQVMWTNDEANESIFEMAFTNTDRLNTTSVGYMWDPRGYGDFTFTTDLTSIYGANDVRYPTISGGIPVRYQDLNGNYNIRVIDYPEVVLNYVEAAFHEGDPNGDALTWLNELANNRNLNDVPNTYASLTLDNILLERRKETAGAGHRYFDLIRNGMDIPAVSDSHLSSDIPYGDPVLAFPIPEVELDANDKINNEDQNPGY